MSAQVPISLRPALLADVPTLNALIRRSASALSQGFYSPEQIIAANTYVFGVDTALIADGSYFVAQDAQTIVACGGWSRRRTLYGGDQRPMGLDAGTPATLDPLTEAARIRAFFVDPRHARRGIGRLLLEHSAQAARRAGFRRLELMATLPGVPLYSACGFEKVEALSDRLPDGTELPFVRMTRSLE